MSNKENNSVDLQKGITDGMQMIADISLSTMKSSLQNITGNLEQLNKVMTNAGLGNFAFPVTKKSRHDCCAPEEECPPHCILQLTRTAAAGERVMVPFLVKNSSRGTKTYRLGLREMKHLDGTTAPAQPELNKKQVTLDAGASELVTLGIDLNSFSNGNTYSAEIVIREKDINQNICFTLIVEGAKNIPVAQPVDEKKYLLRWQSWKSHFYCEPKKSGNIAGAVPN